MGMGRGGGVTYPGILPVTVEIMENRGGYVL